MTIDFIQPPLPAPDVEKIILDYLSIVLPSLQTGTRVPEPQNSQDYIPGTFVRIEAISAQKCEPMTPNPNWEASFLTHTYDSDEPAAASMAATVSGYVAAMRGISLPDWYIVRVEHAGTPDRLNDPMVLNLIRYRSVNKIIVCPTY